MSLSPGTRLGPYEIVAAIGAGGMGEVYRATDTNLKRSVAIKVLPASVAGDADRLARFQREAEVLAALNHPNIAAIYGLEKTPDFTALAMELVDGEDLSAVIARGPLSPSDALPLAKQIADALEAAHEQGIVHRDLKPANVKVRADGTVKVLDFGLAKVAEPSTTSGVSAMNSPTMTSPAMTGMGMILGTAAYMSPEQAKGRAVDKRADIWAFGVVLYEMLTGRRAFQGDDVSDLLVAVLSKDVDFAALPAGTPRSIVALIRRCLSRDPKMRLRDIGEARLKIEEVLSGVDESATQPSTASAKARLWIHVAWATIVVAVAVLTPIALKWFAGGTPAPLVSRFELALPAKTSPFGWPEVSPDGRNLALVVTGDDGIARIWIRPIDAMTFRVLAGTEDASYPFWSPNSQLIGFFAGDTLKKIAMDGGPPSPVCPALRGRGATWSRDGVIVFSAKTSVEEQEHLWQVAETGGRAPTMLAPLSLASFALQRFPHFLPDGRHFLFFASERKPQTDGVYVATLGETGATRIVSGFTQARYSDGTLFFVRDTTLLAQSFDPTRVALGPADPVVVLPISDGANEGGRAFSVSPAGALVAVPRPEATNYQMRWFDRNGRPGGAVGDPAPRIGLRISPDGKRVATYVGIVGAIAAGGSLGLTDMASGRHQRLTYDDGGFSAPVWSQDSLMIFFGMAAKGTGMSDIFRQPAARSAAFEPLLADRTQKFPVAATRDGRYLAYVSFATQSQQDLMLLSLAEKKSSLYAKNVTRARLSPDGRWIAYTGTASGKPEIYIESFPIPGAKIQVTEGGGDWPVWSHTGNELFYATGNKLTAVPVSLAAGVPVPGKPAALFDLPASGDYDVAVDGRFLFSVPVANQVPTAVVTLNWKSSLKKQE